MLLDEILDRLQERVNVLARFVHLFAGTLDAPVMDCQQHAYRYKKPDYRHFVLLRMCRVVSALNAANVLARSGYPQEIGVLHRVVRESTSQISAVMAQIDSAETVSGGLAEFIEAYFEDSERHEGQQPLPQKKLSQRYVNELIGAELDPFSENKPEDPGWKSAAERHQYIDWIQSNYVHGRYPETMDLFGGHSGHFHLHGMKGTPKDKENIVLMEELINSASLSFIRVALSLKIDVRLSQDPNLNRWRQKLGRFV